MSFLPKRRKASGLEHREKRALYRIAPPSKLAVTVQVLHPDGETEEALLIDLSAGGAALVLGAGSSANRELGATLTLIFSSLGAPNDVTIMGKVTHRASGESGTRYGLQFSHAEELFTGPSQLWYQLFNRRRAVRTLPAHDAPVHLVLGDGEDATRAPVRDLCSEGISLLVTGECAMLLEAIANVGVQLDGLLHVQPELDPLPLGLQVCHRRPAPGGLHLGGRLVYPTEEQAAESRQTLATFVQKRRTDIARWNRDAK